MLFYYGILFFACLAYFILNIRNMRKLRKEDEDFDWPFFTVVLALGFETFSLFF